MAREMMALRSVDIKTILKSTTPSTPEDFTWKMLVDELHKTSPTLLTSSLTSLRSIRSKGPRKVNVNAIVGLCCGLLARARSQKLNLVQRLMSVLLYGVHASKQVSSL